MQRSIWIEGEDWESIREWAKKEDRTISRYLVHLHRDFVNFIEHENLRLAQKVVPEIKPSPVISVEAVMDEVDKEVELAKSDVIDKAREKIDGMIAGKGYYPPRPKGQDGKK